jgi:AAA15 family ATPase/GTPase
MLHSIEILGLRGFATKQKMAFASPNSRPGSGLTVIVGANNAGKSTVVEALRAVAQVVPPSFSQGRRNQVAGDQVVIKIVDTDDRSTTLKSVRKGSSETEFEKKRDGVDLSSLLVLPARRVFNPFFGKSNTTRDSYISQIGFPPLRSSTLDPFTYRLFSVEKNRNKFNEIMKEILNPVPEWSIDQTDNGQYFLKIRKGDATHSSEGLGEGLISLLYIVDALYDSKDGDVIVIDEPELSLHPAIQRKLSILLMKYSATRQIVISTHSPYFVGLDALMSGATVARVHLVKQQSVISQLSSDTANKIFGLLTNENNPHIFGIVAQEIFFIDDSVILVEGQEDVLFFKRVESAITPLAGTFFGWGVGGADNMHSVASVLHELGFAKVVGILDANKSSVAEKLKGFFPQYHFFAIPANDVRTKGATIAKAGVKGLLDDDNRLIRTEYLTNMYDHFNEANKYLHKDG